MTPLVFIVAALVLALAPGLALMAVLAPRFAAHGEGDAPANTRAKRIAARLLRLAIAWPLGLAICSVTHFAAFMLFDGRPVAVFAIETLVSAASLGAIAWARLRPAPAAQPAPTTPSVTPHPPTRWLTAVLAVTVIACLLPTLGAAVGRLLVHPHGGWDAWMIWNNKARVLFLGHDLWTRAFDHDTGYAHKDYPLLIPLSIARLWAYAGDSTLLGPIAYALGGTLAVLLLLFAALWRLRDASQGLLALLVSLAVPMFVDNATMQLADMPLSIFLLAALASFTIARHEGSLGQRVVAGLCLGAAAWTKNEGILFMLLFLVTTTAFDARAAGIKPAMRSVAATLAGAAVFGACILAHKLAHAGDTDLFRDRTLSELARLAVDPWRHKVIYRAFVELIEINIGPKVAIAVLVFIVAAALARRRGANLPAASAGAAAAIIIILMAVGYYITYLLTHQELVWHLGTSGMRLMWQLWPSGVFAALMMLPTPAELLMTLMGRESAAEVSRTP